MSASTHPVVPEEVMALLDGELVPERAAAVFTHLETCSDCKGLSAELRETSKSLLEWKTEEFKPSLQEGVLEQAANRQSWSGSKTEWLRHSQLFFSRPLPWALACLMMVVLIGVRFFSFAPTSSQTKPLTKTVLLTNPPPAGGPVAGKEALGGRAADSEGVFHGLADESKYSFSVDGHISDQRTQGAVATRTSPSPLAPMIARTVSLSVVVKDFDAGRAALDAILTRHNGYAASLNVSTPQGAARALQASLRIPAPQLAAALSELKALGRVETETQNGEEVTQQHADFVARLKNSRETEQRLQDVLRTRTGKVKDVLEVEEEMARVRGEIEQMDAEQKALEHRVEFATIDLKLAEEYKAQLSTPAPSVFMQLRNASINGFRNAFENLLGIVLFFAESGPTLALWLAILGIPAWRLWRRYRRAQALPLASGI